LSDEGGSVLVVHRCYYFSGLCVLGVQVEVARDRKLDFSPQNDEETLILDSSLTNFFSFFPEAMFEVLSNLVLFVWIQVEA